MTQPDWMEEIEHTADAGIVVHAGDMRQLFERAAWGMFALITEPESVRSQQRARIELEAGDRGSLMVQWLSELNFRHATEGMVFGEFNIEQLTDERLLATIKGERIDPARHRIHTEIKAVTYHGLEIVQDEDGWRAQIIFDL